MQIFSKSWGKGRYAPLNSSDGALRSKSTLSTILSIFGIICVAVLSFFAGQHSSTKESTVTFLGLKHSAQTFIYNRTFTTRPSNITNEAWSSLFPLQGGFFRHPEIAPKRSTFAVFHQLHCIDSFRYAYWTLFDMGLEGQKLNETELPFHASASHIRHCIDLLRHALMCQPDLTVEVKDEKLGGVTGFGTEHTCVDWKQLVDWTSEWETYGQKPKGTGNGKPHSSHGHSHDHS